MKLKKEITFIDNYCKGFEHVNFNIALLKSFSIAFPSYNINFIGEKEHVEFIAKRYDSDAQNKNNIIQFKKIKLPIRKLKFPKRIIVGIINMKRILDKYVSIKTEILVFCALSDIDIFSLKILLPFFKNKDIKIYAIIHGQLDGIQNKMSLKIWNIPFHLKNIFKLPNPYQLKYILLGEPIYNSIKQLFPNKLTQFEHINHPYIWDNYIRKEKLNNNIKIGFFGVSSLNKGFDQFIKLSNEKYFLNKSVTFSHIGFVLSKSEILPKNNISDISFAPITREEYIYRANEIDFAISFCNKNSYKYRASASFLDSLSFIKPIIAIRNEYLEYYFNKMGEIGYLCDNYEQLFEIVKNIIDDYSNNNYNLLTNRIIITRDIFNPKIVANKIKKIIVTDN